MRHGQSRLTQLEIPCQVGSNGLPLVWRRGRKLFRGVPQSPSGRSPSNHPSRSADRLNLENSLFSPRSLDGRTGPSRSRAAHHHVVPRLRTTNPRTVHRNVFFSRFRRQTRYRGHHSQSLGPRVPKPPARLLFWRQRQACAARGPSLRTVRSDRIRQHRSCGRHGPPLLHLGGPSHSFAAIRFRAHVMGEGCYEGRNLVSARVATARATAPTWTDARPQHLKIPAPFPRVASRRAPRPEPPPTAPFAAVSVARGNPPPVVCWCTQNIRPSTGRT